MFSQVPIIEDYFPELGDSTEVLDYMDFDVLPDSGDFVFLNNDNPESRIVKRVVRKEFLKTSSVAWNKIGIIVERA